MRFQDRKHLQTVAYRSPDRLDARIRLHKLFGINPLDFHQWILENAQPELPSAARLLEVGGGHGRLWSENADRIPAGWQITLTDFSIGMVAAAARDPRLPRGRIAHACLDVQYLPFPSGSIDAVFAHFMLYHVPDLHLAFREIRRVLKPGGRLFATTLGRDHLREIYELAERLRLQNEPDLFPAPLGRSFRLDNGQDELSVHFPDVDLTMYEDRLDITQTEPLVEYFCSMASADSWSPDQIDRLRTEIEDWLRREGVIRVRKEVGMFSASAR